MESGTLDTRLGPLAWQSSGHGPALVFFAGALAHHGLWRDVIARLADRYRCVTVDLPLGSHPRPLAEGADRSAASLARLLPDCLDLLAVDDATVVANDTAGGLLLLSLASGHPALGRIGRLVLTNCESYDHFPPDALKRASAAARAAPRLARALLRLQLRLQSARPAVRRRFAASVTANGLDRDRAESFFQAGPGRPAGGRRPGRGHGRVPPGAPAHGGRRDPGVQPAGAAGLGGGVPVLPAGARARLAADFPHATLVPVPGAKTWVPVDNPAAVADAIAGFVPARVP